MKREVQAGNKILLHPQLRHKKRMPDVLGVHQQVDFVVHRNRHFGGHNVVFGVLVVGQIKTKKVRVRSLISSGWSGPNFPSGPG